MAILHERSPSLTFISTHPLASSGSRGLPATYPRLTAVRAGLVVPAGQRGVRGAGQLKANLLYSP